MTRMSLSDPVPARSPDPRKPSGALPRLWLLLVPLAAAAGLIVWKLRSPVVASPVLPPSLPADPQEKISNPPGPSNPTADGNIAATIPSAPPPPPTTPPNPPGDLEPELISDAELAAGTGYESAFFRARKAVDRLAQKAALRGQELQEIMDELPISSLEQFESPAAIPPRREVLKDLIAVKQEMLERLATARKDFTEALSKENLTPQEKETAVREYMEPVDRIRPTVQKIQAGWIASYSARLEWLDLVEKHWSSLKIGNGSVQYEDPEVQKKLEALAERADAEEEAASDAAATLMMDGAEAE